MKNVLLHGENHTSFLANPRGTSALLTVVNLTSSVVSLREMNVNCCVSELFVPLTYRRKGRHHSASAATRHTRCAAAVARRPTTCRSPPAASVATPPSGRESVSLPFSRRTGVGTPLEVKNSVVGVTPGGAGLGPSLVPPVKVCTWRPMKLIENPSEALICMDQGCLQGVPGKSFARILCFR